MAIEKKIISVEGRLNKLKKANQAMDHTTPTPKIQRVQPYLRDRDSFKKFYLPKLLSIGSIHHGQENLILGEQYKHMWTQKYLEEISKQITDPQELYERIASNIKELKNLYAEDVIRGHDDEDDLAWMLFVDGCSTLYFMDKAGTSHREQLNIKVDQLVLMYQDMLLLENQLPYQVLKLLSIGDHKLQTSIKNFLKLHNMVPSRLQLPSQSLPESIIQVHNPTHLLDLLHATLLANNPDGQPRKTSSAAPAGGKDNSSQNYKVRSIQELKSAGIYLKKDDANVFNKIKFSSNMLYGELRLPVIFVDDFMAPTVANLIAYEMCPDFDNDYAISSYVAFLDTLIDHPEDVKELRKASVLNNNLGGDEEVAELFNALSSELVADMSKYADVRSKIEKHYEDKWKNWLAEAYHTHFRSPWSMVALLKEI